MTQIRIELLVKESQSIGDGKYKITKDGEERTAICSKVVWYANSMLDAVLSITYPDEFEVITIKDVDNPTYFDVKIKTNPKL